MSADIGRDQVLEALRSHIGKARGVRAGDLVVEIVGGLFARPGHARVLRKQIELLRREGHHICGRPETGYFLAETEAELAETCAFLQDRALSSLTQVSAMKRVSIPDLVGQLKLPT